MKYLSKPILYANQGEDVYNNEDDWHNTAGGDIHEQPGEGDNNNNNNNNVDPSTITPEDGSGDAADPTNDNDIDEPGDPSKHEDGGGSGGYTRSHHWKLRKRQGKILHENDELNRYSDDHTLQEFVADPAGKDPGHYKQIQKGNIIYYDRYYTETYQYYCSCGATKKPFRCRSSADPSIRSVWEPSGDPTYEWISQHEFDINEYSEAIFKGTRTEASANGTPYSYYEQKDGICHKITIGGTKTREISSYEGFTAGQTMVCLNAQCGAVIESDNSEGGSPFEITGDWHPGPETSTDISNVHETWNNRSKDDLFSEEGNLCTEISTYESSSPERIYDNDCTLYNVTAHYEVKLTSYAPMMSSWKECPDCGTNYDSEYTESTNPSRSPKLEYDMKDGHKNWVRVGEYETQSTGTSEHDYGYPQTSSYNVSSDNTVTQGPKETLSVRNPDDPTNEQLGILYEYTSAFYKVTTPKIRSYTICNRCNDEHIESEYDDPNGTPTSVLINEVPAPDLSTWQPYPTVSCEHKLSPYDDKYIRKVPHSKFTDPPSADTPMTEHHSNEYLYDNDCRLYNFDQIFTRDMWFVHEGYDYYYKCTKCGEEVSSAYHDAFPYPELEFSEYQFSCDTNIYPVGSTEHSFEEQSDDKTTQSSWIEMDKQYKVTPNVPCTDGTGCRGETHGEISANIQWSGRLKNVWNECSRCGAKENEHVEFDGSPTSSLIGEYTYIGEPTFEVTSNAHEYEHENEYSTDQISVVVHDTETSVKCYTDYVNDTSCEKHSYEQHIVRTLSHDLPYNIEKNVCKYCNNVGTSSYIFGAIQNIRGEWEDNGSPIDTGSVGETHNFEGQDWIVDEILQYSEPYNTEFVETNVNKPNEAECKKYNAIVHMSANIDYKQHTYSMKCNRCKQNIEITSDNDYYPDPDPDTLLSSNMTYLTTDYVFISSDHTWGNELTDTQPAGYPSTITMSRTVTSDYATHKPGASLCEKYDKVVTLTAELTGYADIYYHTCTQCEESAVTRPGSGLYYKPKNEEDMTDSDMTIVNTEWNLVSSDHKQVLKTKPKPGTTPVKYETFVSSETSTVYDYRYTTPSGKVNPCKFDTVIYRGHRMQPKLSGEISSWYECEKCGQFIASNSNGYEISSVDNGPSYFNPASYYEPERPAGLQGQVKHKVDLSSTTETYDEEVNNTLPVWGCDKKCGSKEYKTLVEPEESPDPNVCFAKMNKNDYVRHYRHHRTVYTTVWKCNECEYTESPKIENGKIQKELIMDGPIGVNKKGPDAQGYVIYQSKPTDGKTDIRHKKSDFQAKPYELDPAMKSKMLDKVVESEKSTIKIQVDQQAFQNWLNDTDPASWDIQDDYLVPSEKHMRELPSIIWIESKDLFHPMEYYYNKKQHFYCTKNCGTNTENGPVTTANGQIQTIITKIEKDDPDFPKKAPSIDNYAVPIGTRVISRTRSESKKKYFRQKPNGTTDPNIQYERHPNKLGNEAGTKEMLPIQIPACF